MQKMEIEHRVKTYPPQVNFFPELFKRACGNTAYTLNLKSTKHRDVRENFKRNNAFRWFRMVFGEVDIFLIL